MRNWPRFSTNSPAANRDWVQSQSAALGQNVLLPPDLDLIALSVAMDRETEVAAVARGVRAARLQAIKADVASWLSDGDVSVAAVAARHGATSRYVHKLFEAEGATFSEFVLTRRLELAHRLLTDPRLVSRSITSIALDAGFSDHRIVVLFCRSPLAWRGQDGRHGGR